MIGILIMEVWCTFLTLYPCRSNLSAAGTSEKVSNEHNGETSPDIDPIVSLLQAYPGSTVVDATSPLTSDEIFGMYHIIAQSHPNYALR
jgi:hypothetical protein